MPDDKKAKYWGEARNERRRERYAADPSYRENVLQRARQTQFDTRRAQGKDVREGENCRENMSQLGSFSKRAVYVGETEVFMDKVVTAEDLAALLERDPQVLYRWMGKDMLPRPVFEAYNDRNRKQGVYLNDEARAIMTHFSKHQETSLYFKTSHTDTINNIKSAVEAVRRQRGT